MENAVSKELAIRDVDAWLDYKGVLNSTRITQEEVINSLYELVEEGVLSIDSGLGTDKDAEDVSDDATFNITHKLRVPLTQDGEVTLSSLSYKPRIANSEPDKYSKGVKAGDGEGKVASYICALTAQPRGVIKKLDSLDYAIAQNIVIFFIAT